VKYLYKFYTKFKYKKIYFLNILKMPIPKPRKGEDKNKFVSRCVKFLMDENPKRDQKQAVAICFQRWKDRTKEDINMEKKDVKRDEDGREIVAENVPIIFGGSIDMVEEDGPETS